MESSRPGRSLQRAEASADRDWNGALAKATLGIWHRGAVGAPTSVGGARAPGLLENPESAPRLGTHCGSCRCPRDWHLSRYGDRCLGARLPLQVHGARVTAAMAVGAFHSQCLDPAGVLVEADPSVGPAGLI